MEVDTGTVNLVSKEGDTFPVDIEVARMSELVKGMLEEGKLVAGLSRCGKLAALLSNDALAVLSPLSNASFVMLTRVALHRWRRRRHHRNPPPQCQSPGPQKSH